MNWTNVLVSVVTEGQNFISEWGYLGILLVSLVSSASILFPIPDFILIFTLGSVLNPFLVALFAAIGSGTGECTGYILGLGGKEILKKKYGKQLKGVREKFTKYGSFIWIIILGATPLPDDIVGIFCGIIRYDFKKFYIAAFIGKLILYLFLAYSGYYSINWVLDFIEPGLGASLMPGAH